MRAELTYRYQTQRITIDALWRQLGSKEIFGLPLLFLSILVYFPSTLWTDLQRIEISFSSWLLIFASAHSIFWLILQGTTQFLHLRMSWDKPRPLLNFAGILFSVLVRFIVIIALYVIAGVPLDGGWLLSRFGTALAVACVLFVGGGLLTISRSQHALAMNQLGIAAENLERKRSEIVQILRETEMSLMETAQQTLLPQIEKIKKLISTESTREKLIENIRSTIRGKVRPLSLELHQLAISIEPVTERTDLVDRKIPLIPQKFNIHNSMWPSLVFVVTIAWIVFAFRSIFANGLISRALLMWCAYPIIIAIIKRLIPSSIEVGPFRAIPIFLVIHYLGSVPFFLFVLQNVASPSSVQLVFITYFIMGCVFLALANISAIVAQQQRVESELAAINASLHHELRLLDQKLWIARRNWSSLIHGPVQSSLTVTLFKLQNTQAKIDEQVIDTLNQLNFMLEHGPVVTTTIDDGLHAIRNTWEGVCRFQFHIPEEVRIILENNEVATDCVLEIATEIVGNAYRHGRARWVTFHLNLNHSGDLDIFSQNDGSLSPSANGSGLGSRMLDEVTLYWELQRKDSASITEFSALLPIQKFV